MRTELRVLVSIINFQGAAVCTAQRATRPLAPTQNSVRAATPIPVRAGMACGVSYIVTPRLSAWLRNLWTKTASLNSPVRRLEDAPAFHGISSGRRITPATALRSGLGTQGLRGEVKSSVYAAILSLSSLVGSVAGSINRPGEFCGGKNIKFLFAHRS